MAHAREQIRDWVTARLTALGYTPVEHVTRALAQGDLADWVVTTTTEDIELNAIGAGAREQYRVLDVVTTAVVVAGGPQPVDDTLDDMIEEFEQDWTDRTVGGLARDRQLTTIEVDLNGEGDKIVGTATMTWRVDYVTDEGTPQTAL